MNHIRTTTVKRKVEGPLSEVCDLKRKHSWHPRKFYASWFNTAEAFCFAGLIVGDNQWPINNIEWYMQKSFLLAVTAPGGRGIFSFQEQ